VAEPLGLGVEDAAWAVERVVNSSMANATREVLASQGADPREPAMIAYGGNGPVHAWLLARELGLRRVLVPKSSPTFSALGLLVADYSVDLVRAYVTPMARVDLTRLRALMTELSEEAHKELAPTGLDPNGISEYWYAQVCYPGQNFDLNIPLPDGEGPTEALVTELAERFHHQHQGERGFCLPDQALLLRGLRLVVEGRTSKPTRLADVPVARGDGVPMVGARSVRFAEGFVDACVVEGAQLGVGDELEGPALVQEPFTVVALAPGDRLRLDEHGTYNIRVASS